MSLNMAKELTFEDLAGGGGVSPATPVQKDVLSSLIEFVNRAITLATEINSLITNAKTNLVPLIAQRVSAQITPAGQSQSPPIPTDAESVYKQILDGLENLLKTLGDKPLSEIITDMKKNKEMVIAAIKVKLQAGAGSEPGK